MEDVPLEKQSDYLSSLLTPLCQRVEAMLMNAKVLNPEESPLKIANIQQIIVAINALSKGFSERLVTASHPAIGHTFKQTLDVLLQILVVFPKLEPLRTKVLSFIHRMVDTLGAPVFPYLPKALEQLLAESEPKEMVAFLLLLNQLICKFSTLVHDILEEVFPAIAGRVFSAIRRVADSSGPEANTEACVQIFIKLIKDWCAKPYGEEKVPGLQSFLIETFATNCCLYSVLDKSFKFGDANTLVLFGEIVLAQKVMYGKFGDDFLAHFVSKGFSSAHCP
ncbi:hypothetical protein CRYUN_Cryun32bG0077100 [Craigia yunnanensis]